MKKVLLSVFIACGAMSAHAAVFQYSVTLNGANESPANGSPGQGLGTVNYNDFSHTLQLQVFFLGLIQTNATGGVSATHIHAATVNPFSGTAGVATVTPVFPGFPTGVFSGSYSNVLDLSLASSWNAPFITANGGSPATAEAALANAMAAGKAYWNIHTTSLGGGEIRGFLTPIPEPSVLALVGLGAFGLAARIWNQRRANRS